MLMDISILGDDGLFVEHVVLSLLQTHIVQASSELRDYIDNQTIDKGRYQGRGMFDAMEASTLTDMRDFLHRGILFDIVAVKVLSINNEVYDLEVALMPVPDEAVCLSQEPEDFRPPTFSYSYGGG
jgi:hypothetical protein